MEQMIQRCAGLDVHKAVVVATICLVESALAVTRAKNTALQARYRRVMRHAGHKKAAMAVAHQILEIAYSIQRDAVEYIELGSDYFDRRRREHAVQRHVEQLQALGYRVTIEEAA